MALAVAVRAVLVLPVLVVDLWTRRVIVGNVRGVTVGNLVGVALHVALHVALRVTLCIARRRSGARAPS